MELATRGRGGAPNAGPATGPGRLPVMVAVRQLLFRASNPSQQIAVGQGAEQEPGGRTRQGGAGHLLDVQVLLEVAEHLFDLHAAVVDLGHLGFGGQAGGQVPAATFGLAQQHLHRHPAQGLIPDGAQPAAASSLQAQVATASGFVLDPDRCVVIEADEEIEVLLQQHLKERSSGETAIGDQDPAGADQRFEGEDQVMFGLIAGALSRLLGQDTA